MHHIIAFRPPRIAMTFVLLAVLLNLLLPLHVHPPLPLAAAITAAAGFSLMSRAWWLFKLAHTAICPTHESITLLTHDVYAMTRNPMYLGILLMFAGLAMATGDAAFYAAAVVYAVIIDRVFVRHEERKSMQEFGNDYHEYSQRVRRWL
jgi:protein-S-isoprenylcysteine O-methyltransferase Ste14